MMRSILVLTLGLSLSVQSQQLVWTAQQSGVTDLLIDAYFVSDQEGWVVGNAGTILHTADGGQTWTPQTSGTGQVLRSVQFINSSKGWAAGGQSMKVLLRTIDGGTTWTPSADGINGNQIRDIAFADSQTGWAITADSVYVTSDGGDTWSVQDYGAGIGMGLSHRAITATSDTSAFIATRFDHAGVEPPAAVLDNVTDANALWTPDQGSSFVTDDQMRTICFADPNTGFAGGEQGVLYKLASDGSTFNGPWELNIDTQTGALIRAISFPDALNGAFGTTTVIGIETYALIYFTDDAGTNWTMPDSIPSLDIRGLHAPTSDAVWAVGNNGQIYKGVRVETGIDHIVRPMELNVFPSPFVDALTLIPDADRRDVRSMELLDGTGRRVLQRSVNTSTAVRIQGLDPLGPGVYFIRALDAAGRTLGMLRVVKQ